MEVSVYRSSKGRLDCLLEQGREVRRSLIQANFAVRVECVCLFTAYVFLTLKKKREMLLSFFTHAHTNTLTNVSQ